jgi:hypothetical protein
LRPDLIFVVVLALVLDTYGQSRSGGAYA